MDIIVELLDVIRHKSIIYLNILSYLDKRSQEAGGIIFFHHDLEKL
jgi:hypothetical protein